MQPLNAGTENITVCDVLVAGGGVSGVAAAVSAARGGCRVVLIEKDKMLGGTGVRCMLRTICGLYQNGNAEPMDTLNSGVVREIVSNLRALSPNRTIQKVGKVFVLPYASADLAEVFASLCGNEPNLTVILETSAISVSGNAGKISKVVVELNGTQQVIRPRAVVDCTGSGDIGFLAGAEFDLVSQSEMQLAGCTVHIKGIQNSEHALTVKVPYVLAEAVKNKELFSATRFTTFSAGDMPDEGYLKFSTEGTGPAREQLMEEEILKAMRILALRLPAFRNTTVAEVSGVLDREGRRIRGEYTLTEEDVLKARKFTDGVVKNSWPVELWDRSKGTLYRYLPDGDYYEIPFRCLEVKGFHNLLSAGRCISVTHEALGSTRVMGTCMALGDVAGRAAAGLVKTGKYPDFDKR